MADDILVSSDEEYVNSSSEDEAPAMYEVPDTLTYRFPKNIMVYEDAITDSQCGQRKLLIEIKRCADKLCAFASYGNTRLSCIVSNPVNEADIDDFEAGVFVKVTGCPYVSDTTLCDLIKYIIPSNKLKRTFISVRFAIYSDCGGVVPICLMTAMFALTAAAIEVKGVVTAATVHVDSEGNLTADPSKDLEQKARDRTPGHAYVTAMKIMADDHIRWYDMEGIPKAIHLQAAYKKAAESASLQYSHMSKMMEQLTLRGKNIDGVLG